MKSRNILLFAAGVLLAIAATYTWAWLEGYARANRYFAQAMAAYDRRDWVVALKGSDEMSGAGDAGFTAGFEQALGVWKSNWAWPKPPVYYQAKAKLDTLIASLSLTDAERIVRMYMGRDNEYLPQILWRIAGLYEEQGDTARAMEAYDMLAQGLRLEDPVMAKKAAERLSGMRAGE